MASIGSLTADMRLQSAAFIRNMQKSQQALTTNTAKMRKSMREVQQASRGVERQFAQLRGAALALAGALAVRQFAQFARSAIESGDALAKQSRQLQFAASELQRYRIEADLAGVATDKLDTGVGAFVKRVGELRAGTGTLVTILDKSNVKLKEQLLAAESTGAGMEIMLAAIREAGTAFDKQALSAAAFGRQAGQAMVLLAESAGRLDSELVGLVTRSDRMLAASERLTDQMTLLRSAFSAGFDSAIVEGLAGSVDASAESMREARRIGDEFGRAVGAAMRGVAAAARVVADNWREIVSVGAGFVALKLAGFVINVAVAVTKLALALRAAAAAGALFAASSAGLKKGLVGLAAAGTAIAAFVATAKTIDPAIEDAVEGLTSFSAATESAAAGASANAAALNKSTEGYKREIAATKSLIAALRTSRQAYEQQKDVVELAHEAHKLGVRLATDEGKAWKDAALEAQGLRRELEKLDEAEREASEDRKRRTEEQRELLMEPFKNAIRGIQSSFTDMFEGVFSGGVNSFADLASSVKRIFIRLAAEIATLLVFRPVLGGVLGSLGLGAASGTAAASAGGGAGGGLGLGSLGNLFSLGSSANSLGLFGSTFSGIGSSINSFGASIGFGGFAGGAGPAAGSFAAAQQIGTSAVGSITTAPLASVLGVAGLGALGGGLLASLTGGNQIGGSIGGGLGAGLGFAVGGPIGALVGGALGGFGGGLLGGSKPSVGPGGGFILGFRDGQLTVVGQGGDNGFDPQTVRGMADAVIAGYRQVQDAVGGRLVAGPSLGVGFDAGAKQFFGTVAGDGRGRFASADAAVQNAIFRAVRGSVFEDTDPGVGAALRNSGATSLEGLLSDIEFARGIAGLRTTTSALDQAMQEVNSRFDESIDRARSLGLSLSELNEARDREIAVARLRARAPFIQAAESIAGFLRSQDAAFQSPAQQVKTLQAQFKQLIGRVREGEVGLTGDLLQTADALVTGGRNVFASGVDFQNIDRFVRSSLSSLGERLTSDEFFDAQVEATRQQTEVLSDDLQDVKAAIERLSREFGSFVTGQRLSA